MKLALCGAMLSFSVVLMVCIYGYAVDILHRITLHIGKNVV